MMQIHRRCRNRLLTKVAKVTFRNVRGTSVMLACVTLLLGCGPDLATPFGADETSGGASTEDAGSSGSIPSTASASGTVSGTAATYEADASSGFASGSSSSTGFDIDPPKCGSSTLLRDLPYGHVYLDVDGSDRSRYAGGFSESDTPIEGVTLRLLGSDLEVESCPDGDFVFPAPSGLYVVAPQAHEGDCSQRNCTTRFPEAIEEGAVKIVTLGDSVPVEGAAETFPARVAELVSALADVEEVNLAVSGTQSSDWLPGGPRFEQVREDLIDADVVLVSVGGNDVLNFASTADLSDLGALLVGAQATVDQVAINVRDIAAEIRVENPDADVVFCLYPDYSQATGTPPWSDLGFVPPGVVTGLLVRARDNFTPEDDIVLVDLFGLTPELPAPLDDYLADALHFNDLGHDLYAHEVFRALGGVLVGPSPLASPPVSPGDNRQDFGYAD